MLFLCSSGVVAPTSCTSPRASASLRVAVASSLPGPNSSCTSSKNTMIDPSESRASAHIDATFSASAPRTPVPAMSCGNESSTSTRGGSPEAASATSLCATPCTTVVLPTPAGPTMHGLDA